MLLFEDEWTARDQIRDNSSEPRYSSQVGSSNSATLKIPLMCVGWSGQQKCDDWGNTNSGKSTFSCQVWKYFLQ